MDGMMPPAGGQGPMMGLQNAMGGAGMMGENPSTDPAVLIDQALTITQGHLDGAVPLTPESHQQLMQILLGLQHAIMTPAQPEMGAEMMGQGAMGEGLM
jgi:hypothetical protein